MTETTLRKVSAPSDKIEDSLRGGSQDQISIESVEELTVDPMIDAYPFSNQKIIRGNLVYEEASTYTEGRGIPVDFEFRAGSKLLLIKLYADVSTINPIITQLAEATSGEISVYRNLHAPEDALWRFLMTAERVVNITVLDQGEEVRYDDIDDVSREDVIGEYAIEEALVGFVKGANEILVRYRDGSLQIETNWKRGHEYIIQVFEREVLSV